MRLCAAALLGALFTVACAPLQLPFSRDTRGMSRGMTVEGLQQELSFHASSFAAAVSMAADDISAASPDRRVRRNALVWRLHVIPLAQRAAYQDDPRAGYLRFKTWIDRAAGAVMALLGLRLMLASR